MTAKRYIVALTLDRRRELAGIVHAGARQAFPRLPQIWLQVDQGRTGPA